MLLDEHEKGDESPLSKSVPDVLRLRSISNTSLMLAASLKSSRGTEYAFSISAKVEVRELKAVCISFSSGIVAKDACRYSSRINCHQ